MINKHFLGFLYFAASYLPFNLKLKKDFSSNNWSYSTKTAPSGKKTCDFNIYNYT